MEQIKIFCLNRILVTRILIDVIILVKIRILVDFILTKNIILTRIPVISARILINLIRKF